MELVSGTSRRIARGTDGFAPPAPCALRRAGSGFCWPWMVIGISRHSTRTRRRFSRMAGGYHPAGPPFEGDPHVTRAAEQAVVFQTALAAAIGDGDDVIGLPAWPRRPPAFPCRAVRCRRLRPRPLAMRLDDVRPAEPAYALVALLHF